MKDNNAFGSLIVSTSQVNLLEDDGTDHIFSITDMTYNTQTVTIAYASGSPSWTLTRQSYPDSIIFLVADVSYSNPASETGALFSSPGDIIIWSDFSNYVADLSLNEDPTARANAKTFTLTVNENLVVNGNSTMGGTSQFINNVAIAKEPSSYALDVSGTINLSLIHISEPTRP